MASQDGLMLWDAAGYPVVSFGGVWRQIVLADGYASAIAGSTITAAAADTAYGISWTSATAAGIDVTGDEITFAESGIYQINFTAQIASSSASTVDFYFWPEINGSDVSGSTMKSALHQNGATIVVSRSAVFTMSASDVLRAMWAVSNTNGTLTAFAATAFCPATPSATISITRISA